MIGFKNSHPFKIAANDKDGFLLLRNVKWVRVIRVSSCGGEFVVKELENPSPFFEGPNRSIFGVAAFALNYILTGEESTITRDDIIAKCYGIRGDSELVLIPFV